MSHGAAINTELREKTSVPMGRLGMWWFLGSEIVTFGGMVTAFIMYKFWKGEAWDELAAQTLMPIGTINTVVLLTSSYTMVLAHNAAGKKDLAGVKKFILITMALGALFMVFKGYEYYHEISHGKTPSADVFWAFYYGMTGLHALHMVAGLIILTYVLLTRNSEYMVSRVECAGLYWHFVDIVWIFLFPLLYVTA
jgi:heme/copper-type cytochrome/quinol oxidase subunit 3